jgi:hypothetical protein
MYLKHCTLWHGVSQGEEETLEQDDSYYLILHTYLGEYIIL